MVKKKYYNQEGISLFDNQSSLTTKEFAELKNISFDHAEAILHRYEKNNKLKSHKTKNGLVWTKNKITIIGGGIAAFKCHDLIRNLRDEGAQVTPVLTESGKEFVMSSPFLE